MPYRKDTTIRSPIAREAAARAYHEAKDAAWNDEGATLLRTVRAEMRAMADLDDESGRIYEAENDPQLAPAAVGSRPVHPTRARALAAWVASQGWCDDHLAPVEPMRTRLEILADISAETRAGFERAQAALADYEAERYRDTMGEYPEGYEPPAKEVIEVPVFPVAPAPRRGRPPLPTSRR